MSNRFWGRLFHLFALRLILVTACHCQDTYAGKKDGFVSWTGVGSNVQFQAVEFSSHFKKDKSLDDSIGLDGSIPNTRSGKSVKSDGSDGSTDSQRDDYFPFAWNLGLGYGRGSNPAAFGNSGIVDQILSFTGGLDWQPVENLEVNGRLGLDFASAESYRRGYSSLRIEYTFHLAAEEVDDTDDYDDLQDYDPNDAREYYRHEREEKKVLSARNQKKEKRGASNLDFPQLKVAYHLGAFLHHLDAKPYRLESNFGLTGEDSSLYQYQDHFEIGYLPNRKLALSAGVAFNRYNGGNVTDFGSQIEAGSSLKQVNFGQFGWLGHPFQALVFPRIIFDQSIGLKMKNDKYFKLNFFEVLYATVGQSSSYTVNPVFYCNLSKNWTGGFGLHVTYAAGSVSAVTGSVELGYRFAK